jgi:hypothetical protein
MVESQQSENTHMGCLWYATRNETHLRALGIAGIVEGPGNGIQDSVQNVLMVGRIVFRQCTCTEVKGIDKLCCFWLLPTTLVAALRLRGSVCWSRFSAFSVQKTNSIRLLMSMIPRISRIPSLLVPHPSRVVPPPISLPLLPESNQTQTSIPMSIVVDMVPALLAVKHALAQRGSQFGFGPSATVRVLDFDEEFLPSCQAESSLSLLGQRV